MGSSSQSIRLFPFYFTFFLFLFYFLYFLSYCLLLFIIFCFCKNEFQAVTVQECLCVCGPIKIKIEVALLEIFLLSWHRDVLCHTSNTLLLILVLLSGFFSFSHAFRQLTVYCRIFSFVGVPNVLFFFFFSLSLFFPCSVSFGK
ncbi:hypothetical protein BDZ91DRAFT_401089 [Kalaharituber pfeilii]|nr:hypothetical protein BDZ91DRAFT_401089 [Kalaharituber pfeilii]